MTEKMIDSYHRNINYMRISITDRCNFRCRYCMPEGMKWVEREKLLTFDEILAICKVAISMGIVNFKVTGGEPLIREGCMEFLRTLKQMDGVKTVTLTTNGMLLPQRAEELADIGIDGVNVSVDVLDSKRFDQITGTEGNFSKVMAGIDKLLERKVKTKINAVLLKETFDQVIPLSELCKDRNIDVKFIEMMPIGLGRGTYRVTAKEAVEQLRTRWSDLHLDKNVRGNGPAEYYRSKELKGSIGMIHAVSNPFCENCNRVRLTSQGILKPCLCYEAGIDLKKILREGMGEQALYQAFRNAMTTKPEAHCFSHIEDITEHKGMSEIGG